MEEIFKLEPKTETLTLKLIRQTRVANRCRTELNCLRSNPNDFDESEAYFGGVDEYLEYGRYSKLNWELEDYIVYKSRGKIKKEEIKNEFIEYAKKYIKLEIALSRLWDKLKMLLDENYEDEGIKYYIKVAIHDYATFDQFLKKRASIEELNKLICEYKYGVK